MSLYERQAPQRTLLTPPLRPSGEDLLWAQESVDRCVSRHPPAATALVLGVTPGLVELAWPTGSVVVAADWSMGMIRAAWMAAARRAERASGQTVVQADWMDLPLAERSCDLVLGDASFANISHAQRFEFVRSVRRVLRSGGTLTTRMFVRPDAGEQPDAVWDRLVGGGVGNFAAFKLRLLMSLCGDNGDTRVADAWEYFQSRCSDVEALARRLGWPVEEVQTIQAYRDQPAIYWFPTVAEFRAVVADAFEEIAWFTPTYELGERCPTFVLRG